MDVVLEIGLSNAVATAILAVAALAIGPLCRRRPALVHGLWLLVLLKLLTPPLIRIPLRWPEPSVPVAGPVEPVVSEPLVPAEPPAAVVAGEPASAPKSSMPALLADSTQAEEVPADEPCPAPATPWPWREILGGMWLAGSTGWLLLACWRLWRFRRLLCHGHLAPRSLQERAARLARRLGMKRTPQVWLLPGRVAPLLWWLGGRPRLLLPGELPAHLSSEGLDTVLVHELAHLRRRDHWVRGLELLVMGLYWWHPVVWYARRELREAEEQCCDAWVVTTLPEAGRLYATTLLDTLDFLSHDGPAVPLLASGLGPVTDLKRRLTMILSGSTPRALGWPSGLVLFAVAVLCLPCLPALGQDESRPEPTPAQNSDPFDADAARRVRALESRVRNRQEQLQAMQKQLQDLQKKLEAERDQAGAAKPEAAPAAPGTTAREGEKNREATEVIIRFEGVDGNQVRRLLSQLQRALPPSSRMSVRPAQAAHRPTPTALPTLTVPASPTPAPAAARPAAPAGVTVETPRRPASTPASREGLPATTSFPVPVAPGTPLPAGVPANPPGDPRIDRLERQMEKILQRLDALQKERGSRQHGPTPANPAAR